jgi:hypothetical protein
MARFQAFIEAKRRPLTGEVRGLSAGFLQEGQSEKEVLAVIEAI